MSSAVSPLTKAEIETAKAELIGALPRAGEAACLIGFDGFVDHIIDTVAQRKAPGPDGYARMTSLRQFAQIAGDASGRSANVELVVRETRAGGNGPILAGALATLGAKATCIGAIDHPVFDALRARCAETISLGEPGVTEALEFDDGKLMLGQTAPMDRITWQRILDATGGVGALTERLNDADILAPCGWTMVPAMGEIWKSLATDVLPRLRDPASKTCFVDLSDPSKRPESDLREALATLRAINGTTPVTLGLNFAEAQCVSRLLGAKTPNDAEPGPESLGALAESVRRASGLHRIATHHHKAAAVCSPCGCRSIATSFTPTPRTSTGAGDHFNAGLCLALAQGLNDHAALLAAIATSGVFVRTGKHPSTGEAEGFMDQSIG